MAEREEGAAPQEEQLEEQTSDQAGSLEKPQDPGWDTELDDDGASGSRPRSSRAELYLQTCRLLGVVPVSAFARAVGDTTINLNHYGVGPRGARALAVALQNDKVVTKLELEDNGLQAAGTAYLMEMLESNVTIESLNISHNQLGFEGASLVSKRLLDNFHIKSIRLSGNDLDDAAIELISDALSCDLVVEELDLSGNRFSSRGEELLGQLIGSNDHMRVLDLSRNRLRGATSLFDGLKLNFVLRQLLLSHNKLGRQEAKPLSRALRENESLQLLDLSGNAMDDEAARELCGGLAANGSLRVLKLVCNPITNAGALDLLKAALSRKSVLETLDISGVFVCEDFIEQLEAARLRRPALDVQYSVMTSVHRNLAALQVFQESLEKRNMSMTEFFEALDKDGSMQVSTSDFRKAVKEGNIPLDQQQLSWLVRKFDRSCTGCIPYSQFV